jgi:hypothetical protein
MRDLYEEQSNDILALEEELMSGNFGMFIEYATGDEPICNLRRFTYKK